MGKGTKRERLKRLPISGVEIDLSDRQSVRTSFRLTTEAREALAWLTKHSRVTFKDVFDTLCEELRDDDAMYTDEQRGFLQLLLDSAEKEYSKKTNKPDIPRKTQVVSKRSLRILKEISEKYNISRDVFISFALVGARIVTEGELRESPKRYKKAKEIISNFISEAYRTEEQLSEILADNDPIRDRFSIAIIILDSLEIAIEANLENGTPIDPDDFGQTC